MRPDTEDIYRQQANQVIDYIHANLHKPLHLDMVARQINVSQRQLLRMMRLWLSESLWAYIARQRVERAVLYMQTEAMSLSQLAEMVGYHNPQSLSKAFKTHLGVAPKVYLRALNAQLKAYVHSSGNRQEPLQSQIVVTEAMELVYTRVVGPYGQTPSYDQAWSRLIAFVQNQQALSPQSRFIGISFDNPHVTPSAYCRFYACISVHQKIVPTSEFGTLPLKSGKYAMYLLQGSYSGLQALYNRISIDFEHVLRHGIAFEEYVNSPHHTQEEDLLTKVFIPIQ